MNVAVRALRISLAVIMLVDIACMEGACGIRSVWWRSCVAVFFRVAFGSRPYGQGDGEARILDSKSCENIFVLIFLVGK